MAGVRTESTGDQKLRIVRTGPAQGLTHYVPIPWGEQLSG